MFEQVVMMKREILFSSLLGHGCLPQGGCNDKADNSQAIPIEPVSSRNPQNVFEKERVQLHNLRKSATLVRFRQYLM